MLQTNIDKKDLKNENMRKNLDKYTKMKKGVS